MKRILPDTNIYELILKDLQLEILRKAKEKGKVIFYGIDLIRKELRSIPKNRTEKIEDKLKKLRNILLSTYDTLIGSHQYKIDSKTKNLAENYYIAYAVLKGRTPKEKIINDFRIIASASLHDIDILVSEDNKTMLTNKSTKAYTSVNAIHKLRNPDFIGFKEFKKLIGGMKLD